MASGGILEWFSGHQCIDDILEYKVPERLAQKDMVRRYVNGAGEHRVQGGKDLKQSQSYPAGLLGPQWKISKERKIKACG